MSPIFSQLLAAVMYSALSEFVAETGFVDAFE